MKFHKNAFVEIIEKLQFNETIYFPIPSAFIIQMEHNQMAEFEGLEIRFQL